MQTVFSKIKIETNWNFWHLIFVTSFVNLLFCPKHMNAMDQFLIFQETTFKLLKFISFLKSEIQYFTDLLFIIVYNVFFARYCMNTLITITIMRFGFVIATTTTGGDCRVNSIYNLINNLVLDFCYLINRYHLFLDFLD